MTVSRPNRTTVFAVLVATIAALIARAWLQIELQGDGLRRNLAADLSYLVVPPLLLILLGPVLYRDRTFLAQQFRRSSLSPAVFLNAILIGLLLRLASWARLVAGASFGWYRAADPNAIEGPQFSFACDSLFVVALGFAVMVVLVPLIEEVAHRAYVQSYLQPLGPVAAILISSLVFAVFHRPSGWSFSFLAGIVFGIQYWRTGSLWPSLISHATVNALIQIDWRCLNTQWNPRATDLPLWLPGVLSIVALLLAMAAIAWLLQKNTGAANCPGAERVTER